MVFVVVGVVGASASGALLGTVYLRIRAKRRQRGTRHLMGVQWWSFVAYVWILLTILGGLLDQAMADPQELAAVNNIIQLRIFSMKEFDILFAEFTAPIVNASFFTDLARLLTWDFAFLYGDFNIMRWIVWLPLTAGMSFVAVTQIGPVIIQAIATARGLFRL